MINIELAFCDLCRMQALCYTVRRTVWMEEKMFVYEDVIKYSENKMEKTIAGTNILLLIALFIKPVFTFFVK